MGSQTDVRRTPRFHVFTRPTKFYLDYEENNNRAVQPNSIKNGIKLIGY